MQTAIRSMVLTGLLTLLAACSPEPSAGDQMDTTSRRDVTEMSPASTPDTQSPVEPATASSMPSVGGQTEEIPEELAFADLPVDEDTDADAAMAENALDAGSLENVRLAPPATTNLFAAAAQQYYATQGSPRSSPASGTTTPTGGVAADASQP